MAPAALEEEPEESEEPEELGEEPVDELVEVTNGLAELPPRTFVRSTVKLSLLSCSVMSAFTSSEATAGPDW